MLSNLGGITRAGRALLTGNDFLPTADPPRSSDRPSALAKINPPLAPRLFKQNNKVNMFVIPRGLWINLIKLIESKRARELGKQES